MSGIYDQLDHETIPGFADLNDFTDPGNYFIDDVSSLNLPAALAGFLSVRRDSKQSRFYQSYLAEANSQLFTRTASYSNESGGRDEIIFQPFGYDATTATIGASSSGLFLTATGGTLAGMDGNAVGNDALAGSLLFDIDTSVIVVIVINGVNAILLAGGVDILVSTITTDKGILTLDPLNTSIVDGKLQVAFTYQWTAELEESLVWTAWQNCSCDCGPAPQLYQVSFNADGGAPEPGPLLVVAGTSFVFPNAPVKAGFAFAGWADDENSLAYQPGDSLIPTQSMSFTAQWEAESASDYTVTFDSNGGIPAYEPIIVTAGSAFILPDAPVNSGYTFLGWQDSSADSIHNAGSQLTPVADMHFVAQWRSESEIIEGDVNVYFLTEGANYPILKAAQANSSFTIPTEVPVMEGHTFVKWLSDDFETEYMPGDIIEIAEEDVYLSAGWYVHASNSSQWSWLKGGGYYVSATFEIPLENRYFSNGIQITTTGRDNFVRIFVDWGDGEILGNYVLNQQTSSNLTHLYDKPGRYKIRIAFNNGSMDFRLKSLIFNTQQLRSIDYLKLGPFKVSRIEANSALNRLNCPVLWKGTRDVTDMSQFFQNCTNLSGEDDFVGHAFNESDTTTITQLFDGCVTLNPQWSKKAFSNMPNMLNATKAFHNCAALQTIPARLLENAGNLTATTQMFQGCSEVLNLPVKINYNAGTSKKLGLANMFNGCSKMQGQASDLLARIPVWANATGTGMFAGCTSLSDYDDIPVQFK